MAAVVARYYGHRYVLDTGWADEVRRMAEDERDLYAAKAKEAV